MPYVAILLILVPDSLLRFVIAVRVFARISTKKMKVLSSFAEFRPFFSASLGTQAQRGRRKKKYA
jgi:hypothetical protein